VLHKKFFWTPDAKPLHYDYKKRPQRQEFEGVVHENGAFYLTKRPILETEKNRLGGDIGMYLFPEERGIDIDEPEDWIAAEKLLRKRNKKKRQNHE
jgi:N-acylneuraminate cytidylyltransferase